MDLVTIGILRDALDDAIGSGVTTIDLSGVDFMDSTGVHALVTTASSLDGQGPLVLLRPSRSIARLLDIALPGATPGLVIRTD
ncbi:MAG TPA: STAS domain-containing protein [Actinomycetota bacterium]|nr:STAS domain-containing protein [Actinomycetota bacterium]